LNSGLNMKKTVETAEISTASKVGKRISDKRKTLGLTRKQLAKSAGLKIGSIETTESGRRLPTGEHILKLCEFFGVSSNWILTGADEFLPGPDTGPDASPTDLAKFFVALQQLDSSRRRMLTQMVVDLARAEVPADQLPVFEKIMAAASLLPESVMGTLEAAVEAVVDDDVVQEVADRLGLNTK